MKWKSYPLFRFFSSLQLAVITILTLAIVLAVATVAESLYGMRGAHALVYGRLWFYALLVVLAVNVFCAALSRFPWKPHQTGFVVTHAGILVILFGSFLTLRFGVDGNLPVVEGQSDSEVVLNNYQLTLGDAEAGKSQSFPIIDSARSRKGRLLQVDLPTGEKLVVDEYFPRARVLGGVEPSSTGIGVPALQVELFNSRFDTSEWLLAKNIDVPNEVNLGPALLTFRKVWNARDLASFQSGKALVPPPALSKGYVQVQIAGKTYRVDIRTALNAWVPVASTGYSVYIEKYFTYAVVENNRLVNRSAELVNPCVQLRLKNAEGQEERHTLFSRFPEFSKQHTAGQETVRPFGVDLKMFAPAPNDTGGFRGKLHFAQAENDQQLLYRIEGKGGKLLSQGKVELGKAVATGWMDLQFRVQKWLPAAIQKDLPVYVDQIVGAENFGSALHIKRELANGALSPEDWWLPEGASVGVSMGDRILDLRFEKDRLKLPFQIHLKKFTMQTDPGTTKAASYESDVIVKDPGNTKEPEAHISMNEPLKYGGYTFYQASYQMREGEPPLSVFSVNYDPGRWVKYAGSILMVLGIVVMFLMNPHYWSILVGGKR